MNDVAAAAAADPSAFPDGAGRRTRYGALYAVVWLFFLVPTFTAGWQARDRAAGWIGMAATVAFAAIYAASFVLQRRVRHGTASALPLRHRVLLLCVLYVLATVVCAAVGERGLATLVYLVVILMMLLPPLAAVVGVALSTAVAGALGFVVPGWEPDLSLVLASCLAAFAMWGVTQLMNRNVELVRARAENERLAVDQERNRLARDLHDILGHSLTVITVKAELAGRLIDEHPQRAKAELADLERLSRGALADVRRAVEGYREVTLPAELARAREGLAAAGIAADLPKSTDAVPTDLREVFAWAVREGVTNVIRHSGARRCTVQLSAHRVDVVDDGVGPPPSVNGSGHGLVGLRERAAAVGAVVLTRAVEPRGFALSVVAGDGP